MVPQKVIIFKLVGLAGCQLMFSIGNNSDDLVYVFDMECVFESLEFVSKPLEHKIMVIVFPLISVVLFHTQIKITAV